MKKFTVMALMMMVLSMGTMFAQNRGGNHMNNNNGRPHVEQKAPGKNNNRNHDDRRYTTPKHGYHHNVAPRPHASHHAPVVHHDCSYCTPHHACSAHRVVVHHRAPVVHHSAPVVHHHNCSSNTAAVAGAAVVTGLVLGAIMASN